MRFWHIGALLALALGLAACGTEAAGPGADDTGKGDVSGDDVSVDSSPDAADGTSEHDAPDGSVEDTADDAQTPDGGPDAAEDVAQDILDNAPDAIAKDVAADILEDVPDDIAEDAVADAEADAAEDATDDTAVEGDADDVPDVAADVAPCTDACPSDGATECAGEGVRVCAPDASTGCLTWGPVEPCSEPTVCQGGQCVPDCQDECVDGATQCADAAAVQTCGPHDADPCLAWGPPAACPGDQICVAGACAPPPCEDECPQDGQTQCLGDAVQTCGHHDADACLEWSPAVACGFGLECAGDDAACQLPWLDNYLWNVHAGGASHNDWATAVAVNAAGEALVGGFFTGPMTLGAFELPYAITDVLLAKIDPDGQVLWAKDLGGGWTEQLTDLALAPNGDVVFTGWFDGSTTIGEAQLSNTNSSYDVFLARYTSDGEYVWAIKLGGDGDNEGRGLAIDGAGDLYLSGVYEQAFALSAVYGLAGNAFVARLDGGGGVKWSFGLGGPEYDAANDIAVDAKGNVLVTGSVGSLVDFDPGAGTAQGGPGLFVAKYDPAGKYVWHLAKPSAVGHRLAVDADGYAYVVGTTSASTNLGPGTHLHQGGSTDGFLLKVSPNGATMWSSHLGSAGADALRAVAIDPLGNVLVTGDYGAKTTWEGVALPYAAVDNTQNQDVVVARFAPDGTPGWVRRFGGSGPDHGRAIAAAPTGHVLWAGNFSATVDLNDDTMTSHGWGDMAVVRFTGTSDGSPGCFTDAPSCSDHGACQDIDDTPSCTCEPPWTGPTCAECASGHALEGDVCVPICQGITCPAHQHCDGSSGQAVCVCDAGYTGETCGTCAPGYFKTSGCFGDACQCLPDCGPSAPAGACAGCSGATELWPGSGSFTGFLVGDGNDATGGCGGYGPDHALTIHLTEPTQVDLQLLASSAVLYLRTSCDDPSTQVACAAGGSGTSIAKISELLAPGTYTLWIDTNDGLASTYTFNYAFTPAP